MISTREGWGVARKGLLDDIPQQQPRVDIRRGQNTGSGAVVDGNVVGAPAAVSTLVYGSSKLLKLLRRSTMYGTFNISGARVSQDQSELWFHQQPR